MLVYTTSVLCLASAYPASTPMWMVWEVIETLWGFCCMTLVSLCQCYGYLRNADSPGFSRSRPAARDDHNHFRSNMTLNVMVCFCPVTMSSWCHCTESRLIDLPCLFQDISHCIGHGSLAISLQKVLFMWFLTSTGEQWCLKGYSCKVAHCS